MIKINLLNNGNDNICYVVYNKKTKYVKFEDIKDIIFKLCLNYNDISVTEKNIIISNSEIQLSINNYKKNTNAYMSTIIKKLQREYKELKLKTLRKKKIKRISTFAGVILISGGLIAGSLYYINEISTNKNNNSNTITNNEIDEKNDDNLVLDEKSTNIIEVSFENKTDTEKFQNTKQKYSEIIKRISNEYGIDYRIMLAIATQESGIHNPDLSGAAMGLMQIELAVWDGESISAYNYDKGIIETIEITKEKLKDLEFNIRTACMILKDCLKRSNYNLPVAIQMYNFGYGNVKKVFETTYGDNINFEDTCIDCDNGWLENRGTITDGDDIYLERILSYIEDLEDIQIKKGEEIVNYNIIKRVKSL